MQKPIFFKVVENWVENQRFWSVDFFLVFRRMHCCWNSPCTGLSMLFLGTVPGMWEHSVPEGWGRRSMRRRKEKGKNREGRRWWRAAKKKEWKGGHLNNYLCWAVCLLQCWWQMKNKDRAVRSCPMVDGACVGLVVCREECFEFFVSFLWKQRIFSESLNTTSLRHTVVQISTETS